MKYINRFYLLKELQNKIKNSFLMSFFVFNNLTSDDFK